MSGILLAFAFIGAMSVNPGINKRAAVEPVYIWIDAETSQPPDTRAAFRGTFTLAKGAEVEIRILGASWFNSWVDEEFLAEGPARFTKGYPEFASYRKPLSKGNHVLAAEVIHEGVATRIMESQAPFLFAEVLVDGSPVDIDWKARRIDGHRSQMRRINPQLGWIEWCDTRGLPLWQTQSFDDRSWERPVKVRREIGALHPFEIASPVLEKRRFRAIASGSLAEAFGYEQDDPATRFFLRNLDPKDVPSQGVWRRYDLGKVGLWRPSVTLDLPEGAVVEFAYSEALAQGRVSPWITLSAGPSCHLDHYIARGGSQTFQPLVTRGGRFVEVHVLADPNKVRFAAEEFVERKSGIARSGAFDCGDQLLNRIWRVGADTLDSCMEDAVIDNPTRERGQWTGDVAAVGMEIAAATISDLRHFRRGLVQSAQNARSDGLVAGMCPGQNIYLSTYAALWASACVRYWQLTGEKTLLSELFGAAERNIAAFEAKRTKEGIRNDLAWAFVDWGYVASPGECDVAMNLMYLEALENMSIWSQAVGNEIQQARYAGLAKTQRDVLSHYFQSRKDWSEVGYHRAALGLRLRMFEQRREKDAVTFLKEHMLRCFPNDTKAPRLSDPSVQETRLITPYFSHFVMRELIERGEVDFVLDQYRKCWGWMLQDGRTTWMEVFDPRWSHCHQWSGAPTWQLSRYVLGLERRFDLGPEVYEIDLRPGSLLKAKGQIPGGVRVDWERVREGIRYRVQTSKPITLLVPSKVKGSVLEEKRVEKSLVITLKGPNLGVSSGGV